MQGDPLSMVLCGVDLPPLSDKIQQEHPVVLHIWYADDLSMIVTACHNYMIIWVLMLKVPHPGYFMYPTQIFHVF